MTASNDDRDAVEVVQAYCDAWLAGDTMTVLSLYHDDLTLEWPGRHRFAGVHVGQKASIEALLGLQSETNRIPIEVVDVMAGSNTVAVSVVERWSRDGDDGEPKVLEHARILEYTVQDQQLRTCRVFESAPYDVEDWLASASAISDADVVELLTRCSAGWAARDVKAIIACHTDDTTFENHGLTVVAHGNKAVSEVFETLLADHPELSTTPLRTTFGADHAIVEYEVHTSIDGGAMWAPAVDVFRFRDGLIASKDTWVSELRSP